MLQATANVAPRSVYVCGNTTTTSGLTVSFVYHTILLLPKRKILMVEQFTVLTIILTINFIS